MNKALEILKNCRARGQKRAGGIDLDEAIAEHEAQLKAKDEENEKLKEAMQEFVSRVEKGEVRSSYTYSKFKELLNDNQ